MLPHTHRVAEFVDGYMNWIREGRAPSLPQPLPEPQEWDPDAPPDPNRYAQIVPVSADFQVTAFFESGVPADASALEAARALLEARFDLQLGIWDLVANETLRRTLLETVPVTQPPAAAARVPTAVATRAKKKVDSKMTERAAKAQALERIAAHFDSLSDLGWERLAVRPAE